MSAATTYAEQLVGRGYGLPLWHPEPTKFGEVQIGDVGYVDDGCFYRLFNAIRPASDPLNKWGVPENFVELVVNADFALHTEENYLQPGPVCTTSTAWKKTGAGVSATAQPIADIALSYTFSCHKSRGAIAILEDTAKQERAVRSLAFREYICQHHASWYALAKKLEVYVHPSDLVLVYGCVKTSAWALATFASSDSDHKLSLSVSGASFPSAKFEASSHRDVKMSMEQRAGPQRSSSTPTQRHESDKTPKDQCLFLDYYKLKTRKPGMKILQGEARAQDVFDSPENQCFCMPYSWLIPQRFRKPPGAHSAANNPGTTTAHIAEVTHPRLVIPSSDPLDCVLDYILESSKDADVAVASHDDLYNVCSPLNWPTDIVDHLRRTNPTVAADGSKGYIDSRTFSALSLLSMQPIPGVADTRRSRGFMLSQVFHTIHNERMAEAFNGPAHIPPVIMFDNGVARSSVSGAQLSSMRSVGTGRSRSDSDMTFLSASSGASRSPRGAAYSAASLHHSISEHASAISVPGHSLPILHEDHLEASVSPYYYPTRYEPLDSVSSGRHSHVETRPNSCASMSTAASTGDHPAPEIVVTQYSALSQDRFPSTPVLQKQGIPVESRADLHPMSGGAARDERKILREGLRWPSTSMGGELRHLVGRLAVCGIGANTDQFGASTGK